MTPRFDLHTELMLGTKWTDVTSDVRLESKVKIKRGRADEASRTDHGKMDLTFKNGSGKYTPRNPLSPLYGLIGRNTPIRQWIGTPPTGDAVFVNTPPADSLTDLNHAAPSVLAHAASSLLICGWITGFEPGTYTAPGSMVSGVQTHGSFSSMLTATEVLAGPGETGTRTASFAGGEVHGHAQVSVTVPGAAGPPVVQEALADESDTGYVFLQTAPTTQAGWWLLAIHAWDYDPAALMPVAPIDTPGPWIPIGNSTIATSDGPHLRAWARPVLLAGAQQVAFAWDNIRDPNNHARLFVLSNVAWSSLRFSGEVPEWPPRWDTTGSRLSVPIKAAGILRRLGQGAKALRSAIYRETLADYRRPPLAYWPCEDGRDSRSIASATAGVSPAVIFKEPSDVSMAAFDGFDASEPIPTMRTGSIVASVPRYQLTDEVQVRWLMHVGDSGATDQQPIMTVFTETGIRWQARYLTGGAMSLRTFGKNSDGDIKLIDDSGPVAFALNGRALRVALEAIQEGANIRVRLGVAEPGASGGSAIERVVNNRAFGIVQRVTAAAQRNLGDVAIGHISVHDEVTSIFDLGPALNGHTGETAGRRIERLCSEESVPLRVIGNLDDTAPCGPQRAESLLTLLEQAAAADSGILIETREDIGLTYRTRTTLYNQGVS